MSTMNPLISILILLLRLSESHAQTLSESSPSTVPTSVATRSTPPSLHQQSQSLSPSAAPFSKLRPTQTPSKVPVLKPSLTDPECANDPEWYYEFWDYSPASCWETDTVRLSCDDYRVECYDFGNFGLAEFSCCKCKSQCQGQCNDPTTGIPTPAGAVDDCYYNTYDDDYEDEDDSSFITTFTLVAMFIFGCVSVCLRSCNGERQHEASLEANRQTMATRRQEQRQSNSQGLTDEERNHARYELFKSKFHFQTVLADKSNISANSLRISATKPGEEHQNDDEASAIGTSERPMKSSLSRRLSSWRRPSAKDECCICLECYTVGETICAPITTECDHVFHEGCILQWVKNNDRCPLCRVELLKE